MSTLPVLTNLNVAQIRAALMNAGYTEEEFTAVEFVRATISAFQYRVEFYNENTDEDDEGFVYVFVDPLNGLIKADY